jgi:hypothetical protein
MSEIRRVTLYKIKSDLEFDDYLNGDLNTYDAFADTGAGYSGYIRYVKAGGAEKTDDAIPWLRFLNSGFDVKRYTYVARNFFPRAIMALRVSTDVGDNVHYVATFGQHGDTFLDRSRIVHDFGIKVGMNICDIDKLRRVQTSAHEAISRQTERQASIGASLRAFGINTEAEILRTLAGSVKDARRFIRDLTASKLRTWPIYRYDEEQERTFPLWNAYHCIVAELEYLGKTYVLSNGLWREVSQELKDKVDGYFNARDLAVDAPYLPTGTNIFHAGRNQNREEVYNEAAARGSDDLFLLDQAKIEIAGRRLYEVCDLLHGDKHFVHVKKYASGSASISHLFTQAKMYSHAICSDEPTRVGIAEWVQNDDRDANAPKDKARFAGLLPAKAADFNDTDYTVVFCILHDSDAFALEDLPFMARYELMLAHSYLTEDRRFKAGVCFRRVELGQAEAQPTP